MAFRFIAFLLLSAALAAGQGKYREVVSSRIPAYSYGAELSPDGKQLLYQSHETLYVLDTETGMSHQFFDAKETAGNATFSADGKWIYYDVSVPGKPGVTAVYRMGRRPDAGVIKRPSVLDSSVRPGMVVDGGCAAKPSPDGVYLAFYRACRSLRTTLSIARADGSEERTLPVKPSYLRDLIWSQDSETVLTESGGFNEKPRLTSIAVRSGQTKDLPVNGPLQMFDLARLDADGLICLRRIPNRNGSSQVWRYRLSGGEWTQLTNDSEGFRSLGGMNADGSTLAAIRAIDNGSFLEGMMDAFGMNTYRPDRWTYELVLLKK